MRRMWFVCALVLLSVLYFYLELRWAVNWTWSFDSDEAIFGLMASHIRQGEIPLFYYGQSYIGSFSAFALAGLSSLFGVGPSTVKLLALILCWGAYILFTLALYRRYRLRSLVFLAAAILISPASHLWAARQRGPAEHLFIMGLVLLTWLWWRDYRTRREQANGPAFTLFGLALGFSVWSHLGVILLVLPLLLQESLSRPGFARWRDEFRLGAFLNWSFGGRALSGAREFRLLNAGIILAEAVAIALFLTGGRLLPVHKSAGLLTRLRYPTLLAPLVLCLIAFYHYELAHNRAASPWHFLVQVLRRWSSGARELFTGGLVIGLLPGLVGFFTQPKRVQFPLPASIPQVLLQAVRFLPEGWSRVFGLGRNPAGWLMQLALIAVIVTAIWQHRSIWSRIVRLRPVELALTEVFLIAVALDVLVFIAGDLAPGSSAGFRYLVPVPILMVAAACSFLLVPGHRHRYLGVAFALLILALAVLNQTANLRSEALKSPAAVREQWNRLAQEPETDSLLQACRQNLIRHLEGDYWLAYRLTFLSNENLVVAPLNGMDRYPRYTEIVRRDSTHGFIGLAGDSATTFREGEGESREIAVGSYRVFVPSTHRDSVSR